MELGTKIKNLRMKKGVTQECVAKRLGVTYQTVSKWENNITLPDIQLLPEISVYFGITIDELFELTREDRLTRIDSMLEDERVLTDVQFDETLSFLKSELDKNRKDGKIYTYLAKLYLHRSKSAGNMAAEYAKLALQFNPESEELDCHQVFMHTGNSVIYDWNASNHHKIITYYYQLIHKNPRNWHLYLFLLDNLIADFRIQEAKEILKKYEQLQGKPEYKVMIYNLYLLIAEGKEEEAQNSIEQIILNFGQNAKMWFDLADFMAKRCRYDEAIEYYEKSFKLWEKPRYVDSLEAIAHIYEIQGMYSEAMLTWKRIIEVIKEEFDIQSGEILEAVQREYHRLSTMQ